MSKLDKTLVKMRNNPRDWQIAELEAIAFRLGITTRQGKGSHVCFSHPMWPEILTVPAHRPIKPIYIKKLISLIDMLNEEEV